MREVRRGEGRGGEGGGRGRRKESTYLKYILKPGTSGSLL
jgi:hypothetical protein